MKLQLTFCTFWSESFVGQLGLFFVLVKPFYSNLQQFTTNLHWAFECVKNESENVYEKFILTIEEIGLLKSRLLKPVTEPKMMGSNLNCLWQADNLIYEHTGILFDFLKLILIYKNVESGIKVIKINF